MSILHIQRKETSFIQNIEAFKKVHVILESKWGGLRNRKATSYHKFPILCI